MSQLPVTVAGRLTQDPELVKVSPEMYKTRVRVASSRRVPVRNREDKISEWRDVDLFYTDIEVWGQFAVNVRKSLKKGMPILATGSLVGEEWHDANGQQRSRVFLKATMMGLDLNHYVIGSTRNERKFNQEGVQIPDLGNNEIVPDIDRTQSPAEKAEPKPADDPVADTPADAYQAKLHKQAEADQRTQQPDGEREEAEGTPVAS